MVAACSFWCVFDLFLSVCSAEDVEEEFVFLVNWAFTIMILGFSLEVVVAEEFGSFGL